MTQTWLRGVEIGGIQIGIEVPQSYGWEWPEGPIADFSCLPRSPEVHVGVRVADISSADLGGERYGLGAWTFEVARRGADWLLGLSRRGVREQLAVFDRDFCEGEVVFSREAARSPRFPLRSPLDEWIVLHRTVARGGLVLHASAQASDGQARIRLGSSPLETPARNRWISPRAGLFGRETALVREEAGHLRHFRTPWTDAADPTLGYSTRVLDVVAFEEAARPFSELLDPAEAADLLVTHAIVPLCDESLLDRVLENSRKLSENARVLRLGDVERSDAPMAWQSAQLQGGFAPPRHGV